MPPILYIVIPCYNEEAVLPVTCNIFLNKLIELENANEISTNSKILFVNDGSTDNTWNIICELAKKDKHYTGISQSCNRGHQSTLLAGLMEAKDKCDITVSIDCDGQDDINAINEMVKKYKEGYEIVYGVRDKRTSDSFFKRITALTYYKILALMGVNIVYNHSDYRLLSAKVLAELAKYKEVNLFLRGLIPTIGFKSTKVYYDRKKRMAGKTHYSLSKMLTLAFDGITSFSSKPLLFIVNFGFLVAFVSFLGVVWSVVMVMKGQTVRGWASMTSIICFVSGIQLICTGILGEYIGKMYMEIKQRPRYIISEKTDKND